MLKKVLFLFLIIIAGCSNPPPPKEKTVIADPHLKDKATVAKAEANYWTINSFAPKKGATEGNKYIQYVTDGTYSDSSKTGAYLYAEILFSKQNAGIFLHKLNKIKPSEKFNDAVQIKMTNPEGTELQMTSTKSWSSQGGILIERNNNDYSQFRIFLLQSKGPVKAEIRNSGSETYYFTIYVSGLNDSFNKLGK
jgi:hypothetical protein